MQIEIEKDLAGITAAESRDQRAKVSFLCFLPHRTGKQRKVTGVTDSAKASQNTGINHNFLYMFTNKNLGRRNRLTMEKKT